MGGSSSRQTGEQPAWERVIYRLLQDAGPQRLWFGAEKTQLCSCMRFPGLLISLELREERDLKTMHVLSTRPLKYTSHQEPEHQKTEVIA